MHKAPRLLNTLLQNSVFLGIAVLASACASHTSVSSNWHDNAQKRSKFERVLIVAVTDNTDRRLSFEDAVAQDLRSDTTQAWSSARLMDSESSLDETSINEVARQQLADAVVITRVESLDVKAVEIEGRTDVSQQRKKGTLFRYDYIEKEESSYITTEYTTSLITDVYATKSGDTVYTVMATATKQETLADVIDVLSDVIARQLRQDGVIR